MLVVILVIAVTVVVAIEVFTLRVDHIKRRVSVLEIADVL